MKLLTLTQVSLLAMTLSLSQLALAQANQSERKGSMQGCIEQLNLTDEQRQAFKEMRQEARDSRDSRRSAMRMQGQPLSDEQRQAVRESRQAQMQKRINAILTEEQQALRKTQPCQS